MSDRRCMPPAGGHVIWSHDYCCSSALFDLEYSSVFKEGFGLFFFYSEKLQYCRYAVAQIKKNNKKNKVFVKK